MIADTEAPFISAMEFKGPERTFLKIGDRVSVKLSIQGTSLIPIVTLFNGAAILTAPGVDSPYTFSYVIERENGPIVYHVKAVDEAGNESELDLVHAGRIAGIQTRQDSHTLDTFIAQSAYGILRQHPSGADACRCAVRRLTASCCASGRCGVVEPDRIGH